MSIKILYQDDDTSVHEMSALDLLGHLKQQRSFKYKGFEFECLDYNPIYGYEFRLILSAKSLDDFHKALRKRPKILALPHGFRGFYKSSPVQFGSTKDDWSVSDLNKNTTKTFKTHAFFVKQAKGLINSFLASQKNLERKPSK